MKKRLIEYTKYKSELENRAGSYKLYIEYEGEYFYYHGITDNLYKRMQGHKACIKRMIVRQLQPALKKQGLYFREASYQKIVMFLIDKNIPLNELYFEFQYQGNDEDNEYKKIRNDNSDIKGFNGAAFVGVQLSELDPKSEEYQKCLKKIKDQKERVLKYCDDILPHNVYVLKWYDWFYELPKKVQKKLIDNLSNYFKSVANKYDHWVKENQSYIDYNNKSSTKK